MSAPATAAVASEETQKLSPFALTMMVVGSMIGAGIWSLPRAFGAATGRFAPVIAWTIAAGAMYFLACVFQALAGHKPDLDEGVYAYAQAGFGDYLGFLSALGYFISACLGNTLYWALMKSTLGAFFPIFGNGDTIAAVAVSSIARFPVLNPCASLAGVARYVCGEPQTVPRIGGHKYFYLSWKLDIWRCEAWNEPLGSVFDLDRIPDRREPCNACIMGCYRNASMLMHAGVAATDAARALATGDFGGAAAALFRRGVVQSLWAPIEETPKMRRLARWRSRRRLSIMWTSDR